MEYLFCLATLLATVGSFAGNIPVTGPFIQKILDRIGGGRRIANLPVLARDIGGHG